MKPIIFETAFSTYKTINILGEGGSGRVFRVKDPDGVEFGLKLLDFHKTTSEKRKRFSNEINFCEKNSHKNVIKVLDRGLLSSNNTSSPFYIMPLYDYSLRELIKNGKSQNAIINYYEMIINGVEVAHLKGIYHRDIKPENILYDAQHDNLVVADFGIAHFSEEDLFTSIETQDSSRLANFQYASPEQREREAKVDQRADIYALGLILNEMFTGRIPIGTGYKTIRSVNTKYSYLDEIVEKMINQDPSKRFQSIKEVKETINIKGKESISQQRLSQLNNTVILSAEIDDPIILDPIRIVDVDWQNFRLILILNQPVNDKWVNIIKNLGSRYSIHNKGPEFFRYQGNQASIQADENEIEPIIRYFKQWLIDANIIYERNVIQEQRKKDDDERERIKKEIEIEEKRNRILQKTKI